MTPQEIQIAVAEEMGWFVFQDVGDWVLRHEKKCVARTCGSEQECWDYYLHVFAPPYTTSIDAIRGACLERFSKDMNDQLLEMELLKVATKKRQMVWQLTALDWCEAFLETVKQLKS